MSNEENMTITQWLEAKRQLEAKLKAAGIEENDWPTLYILLGKVTETDLNGMRDEQFKDDAWDLLADMKSASEKNVARTSAFLRKFAEHIAAHILQREDVQEIIDGLAGMSSINE